MLKGVYLDSPIKGKNSESGQNEHIIYGATEMQGWRFSQEDAHNCILNFDKDLSFFAVYDGHGGPEVSKFASRNLPSYVKKSRHFSSNLTLKDKNPSNIEQSLIDAFLSFDLSLIKKENLSELKRLRQEFRGPPKNLSPEVNCCSIEACSSKTVTHEITTTTTAKSVKNNSALHHSLKTKLCHKEVEIADSDKNIRDENLHLTSKKRSSVMNVFSNLRPNWLGKEKVVGSSDSEDEENRTSKKDRLGSPTSSLPVNATNIVGSLYKTQLIEAIDDLKAYGVTLIYAKPGVDSGSTACVLVVDHASKTLYVANVGDSRCVLCRSNGSALDLSQDHKPDDPIERRRIERAGGWLGFENRVNGILNLSRCFGDHAAKNSALSSECQIVSAYPDVKVEKLKADDRFLILACDGIWNSLSSQELVDLVSLRLSKGRTPVQVCEEICDICLSDSASGSDDTGCDNMTIIIVKFLK